MLFKDKKRKLLAGLDLDDQYSQISFVYTDRDEPVTVSTIAGKELYNVPTVLCKRQEVNQWFYGKEALKHASEEGGFLIRNLLNYAYKGEEITIEEEVFSPIDLLALYVRRVLAMMQNMVNNEKPDGLMITVGMLDRRMIEVLTQLVPKIGMESNSVFFQSYMESFFQFTIHQPEELWINQVIVCDYSKDYMKCYRLETNRKTVPVVAFIEEKSYRDMVYEKVPEEEPEHSRKAEELDTKFTHIVEDMVEGRMVTTCYLIGEGFLGKWCKESLKVLCRNRRVFQGNNLYSKGACYTLAEKYAPTDLGTRYVFLGKDKVKANIGMVFPATDKAKYLPVIDAGVNWYDAKREWDVILEQENQLYFVITPLNKKNRKELVMTLDHIPVREDGLMRLHLSVFFTAEDRFEIHAKDMGFGEFYPASDMEWKEEVAWEE